MFNLTQIQKLIHQNSGLQAELKKATDGESFMQRLVKFAQNNGLPVAMEQLQEAIATSPTLDGMVELDDEQLEAIAGGVHKGAIIASSTCVSGTELLDPWCGEMN